jgi:hypothetical protein
MDEINWAKEVMETALVPNPAAAENEGRNGERVDAGTVLHCVMI